jgi:hypothetical protein
MPEPDVGPSRFAVDWIAKAEAADPEEVGIDKVEPRELSLMLEKAFFLGRKVRDFDVSIEAYA